MVYLKWLIRKDGTRVEEWEALAAFRVGDDPQPVATAMGWTFVPVAGVSSLEQAVTLLFWEAIPF